MKNTFKKVVGLLLAVLMVVSVCTVAFATEEETVPVSTFQDLGIIEGTGVTADTIVNFEGEDVIQMHQGVSGGKSGNYNLKLADPNNPGEAFVAEAGKSYTVLFDYYLFAKVSFQVRPMADPTATGQRGAPYKDALVGYSHDFVGDGKWHTAAVPFTYATVTGGGVTLNNIGLLHQCDVDIDNPGYIKNIRIVEDAHFQNEVIKITNIVNGTNKLFNTGKATSNYDVLGKVTVNADKTVSIIPNKNQKIEPDKPAKATACFAPLTTANAKSLYILQPGYTYKVTVRYKVDKSSTDTTVGVGYAYGYTDVNYKETTPVEGIAYTGGSTTDGWETLVATINTDKASTLKITVSGTGAPTAAKYTKVTFDDIVVSKIEDGASENVFFTNYNDNGLITVRAGYAGTDIAVVGDNNDNLALGEKFFGWHTDANCTEATDKVVNGTIYAKYPTVFIDDFTALKSYEAGNQKQGSVTLTDGSVKLVGNTGTGFVVPAYDDEATTPAKFIPGKEYYVRVYYKSVDGKTNTGVRINMITGDRYGTEGARTGNNLFSKFVSNGSTNGVVSQYFTQAELEKKDKSGFVENMILRADTQDKVSVESVITRIAITDPALVEEQTSEEMLLTGSIRKEKTAEDGTYTSAGIRFKARVSAATRDAASEIGFVAVPTAYLNGASIADYVATEGNKAVFAKVKSEGAKEVVYAIDKDFYQRDYTDYQMIMTGLTREDTDKNLLSTKMTVALYVTIDGVTTYTDALSFSYDDIAKYY